MNNRYLDGSYLKSTSTWHAEDSEWKAKNIGGLISEVAAEISSVVEIGCGAGGVIGHLSTLGVLPSETEYSGFDISPQAIELAKVGWASSTHSFFADDYFSSYRDKADLLIAADVFEHVPDYMQFLENAQRAAAFKVYHIPLDINVSSVFRRVLPKIRSEVGHLHYFTEETALAVLEETGHTIVGSRLTCNSLDLASAYNGFGTWFANLFRRPLYGWNPSLVARTIGGCSLLVLAK